MADPSKINEVQRILPCEICELDKVLNWHCHDCSLSMCQTCKEKIHVKFKSANTHKVTEVHNEEHTLYANEGKFLSCKTFHFLEHKDQFCCLFCTTYDELICGPCVTS